jgi:hypothetical protein
MRKIKRNQTIHYVPIILSKEKWAKFKEIMKREGISSNTFAVTQLVRKAVDEDRIIK